MSGRRRILESDILPTGESSGGPTPSVPPVAVAIPTAPKVPATPTPTNNLAPVPVPRQIEIHHPEAFEQLDGLLTLSTVRPWLIVGLLAIFTVLALVFSLLYEVPTKVRGRGLLLVDPDSLAQVVAPADGILIEVHLREGQRIRRAAGTRGFEVVERSGTTRAATASRPAFAVVAQEDLLDLVNEKFHELERAQLEDAELTRQEQEREERQTLAKREREEKLKLLIDLAERRITLWREQLRSFDLLMSRDVRNVNRQEYIEARTQLDQAENERGQAMSDLSQLQYEFLKEKDQRREEQLKRRLAIARLKDETTNLEARHRRKSLVTFVDLRRLDAQGDVIPDRSSPFSEEDPFLVEPDSMDIPAPDSDGVAPSPDYEEYQVHAILKSVGAKVEEGQPIALLERINPNQTEHRRNDLKVALVFVPTEDGKRIRRNQEVEISPTTIQRVEYGYIRGRVVDLSNLPATEDAVLSRLKHPALVSKFLQGPMVDPSQKTGTPGVFTLVTIELLRHETLPFWVEPDGSNWVNRLVWSSRSGNAEVLEPWTLCEASIKVKSQPLLSLVLPWLKRETQLEPPNW